MKEGVFQACKKSPSESFFLAFGPLINSGQIFGDIGYIGGTGCSCQILEGTFRIEAENLGL